MKTIPFDINKLGELEVVYRNAKKPKRVIQLPEASLAKLITIDDSGDVLTHNEKGEYRLDGVRTVYDLFMLAPEPKRMSGWVNVYQHNVIGGVIHKSKEAADSQPVFSQLKRIACIDLSTHFEGEGLEEVK